jgi:hypothetical protein
LPIEIWREVTSWLSRADLRNLLAIRHPLREVASEFFARNIFLQFLPKKNVPRRFTIEGMSFTANNGDHGPDIEGCIIRQLTADIETLRFFRGQWTKGFWRRFSNGWVRFKIRRVRDLMQISVPM